jgi:parvulin-like peptidyl-prolyl isomerase
MSIQKRRFIVLAILAFIILLNCRNSSVPSIEVVAKVEGENLSRDDLFRWIPSDIPEEQKAILSRQYIDRWVQKTVLAQAAKAEGIKLSEYENWSLEFLEKEMLSQKYLAAKLPRDVIITDQEISTYYDRNVQQFLRKEDEVHLVQLYLDNRDRAIDAEIREQGNLLEVIKKNYLDSQPRRSVEKNGDLGYVPINSLKKEIARLVRSGNTGRIYGPINIEQGYYYFQMMDKQSSGSYRSLDLVEEEIRLRLIAMRREKLTEELAQKLVEKSNVKIFPEHIK